MIQQLRSFITLSLLLFLCYSCKKKKDQQPLIKNIDTAWEFKAVDSSIWRKATVPGTIHTDLFDNNIITDPFVKDNELKLQWISEHDWEYQTSFKANQELLAKQHITLNFDGLDTYATIYLNDSLILKTDNAFRRWSADIKPLLKPENQLKIVFQSPTAVEELKKKQIPYELPEGNRIFTRKPQFHYGWDWGPKFITSGVTKTIYLKAWDHIGLSDVFIKQHQLTDQKAVLSASIELNNHNIQKANFDIMVNDSLVSSSELQLTKGNATYDIPFCIVNPKRWWTHNLGEPYRYDITIRVHDKENEYATKTIKKGLRTIELITKDDTNQHTFHFKLNGHPVYMKGANYIPQNSFQNKVTKGDYHKTVNDAVAANMNMLRVWGGGIYENDIFYDLCDEKGILLWQDFMFACAMYPGDKQFLDNIKQEAIDNIKRLRNHCSIALWCGNNESSEGWHRWGWQDGKTEAVKNEIWENYLKVFNDILPKAVHQYADNIPYWESSPKFGRGDKRYINEGDAHDWWVWHDGYPFEHYETNVPRFMSEFGFQSYPSYEAIKYINQSDSDSITISGNAFKSHQKHHRGTELINLYMERDFPVPSTDDDYVYVSQLLQAYGITKGIEAQRRKRPYCMGSLYWQLNDCWPVVSWSSIDGLGNWKALHYKARESFSDILISPEVKNDSLNIYVINDQLENRKDSLSLKIIDFNGKELWKKTIEVNSLKNNSSLVFSDAISNLTLDKTNTALITCFNNKQRIFYFEKPKKLKLMEANILQEITKVNNGFEITLTSDTLQKDVFLYSTHKGHFESNFFDLISGEKKTVLFTTDASELKDLSIKTLNQIILKTNHYHHNE